MLKNRGQGGNIVSRLHDAGERQKLKLAEKERQLEEERKNKNKSTSNQSHKLILQKFMRDLHQIIQAISQEETSPQTLNYLRLKELLIALGLITEQSATGDSQERVLLYDFWRTLGGEEK